MGCKRPNGLGQSATDTNFIYGTNTFELVITYSPLCFSYRKRLHLRASSSLHSSQVISSTLISSFTVWRPFLSIYFALSPGLQICKYNIHSSVKNLLNPTKVLHAICLQLGGKYSNYSLVQWSANHSLWANSGKLSIFAGPHRNSLYIFKWLQYKGY